MKTFEDYKKRRMSEKPDFWKGYLEKFESFKLGILLKQAREKAGLTKKELADKLSISTRLLSGMENNAPEVKLLYLEKFADALGRRIHVVLD